MTSPYPLLRNHSYYGFLESLLSPESLVSLAHACGIRCLGLTDHKSLSGVVPFYEACLAADLKPILGLEIDLSYQGSPGQLALLAKDREGWANLSRLSTHQLSHDTPITLEQLAQHQEGLIAIEGDSRGLLRHLLIDVPRPERYSDIYLEDLSAIFKDAFFIEIQRFINGPMKNERLLLGQAARHNLKLIATQSIFYATPQEETVYQTLTAIRHAIPLQSLTKSLLPPGPAYFPAGVEFTHRFRDLPEALDNLHLIEEQCQLELPLGETHFPKFPTPEGVSQAEFLSTKAYRGAQQRYAHISPEIKNRLDYELEVITSMGYEPIFLIVEDVLNHARRLGIPTSSRGSAASSLVAHCLNITSPDPIALNLYFERFLNPARKKPPDIDTDIASHRRDEVIQYVFDTYGADRVAMVGTISRYRPKSALGDVAKAYGLSPETVRQLSRKLPNSYSYSREEKESDPFAPLLRENTLPVIQAIAADARALLDLPRHLSVHPGGIVIAPFPITELVPLTHSSTLGINHTQVDLGGIEKFGLVKIDLLGIRGLTVLGEVADRIQSWHLSEFENSLDVLSQVPADDAETGKTVREARTIGCFQIESPGMRATLREIQAQSVADIMAVLALYRPGPLRGGLRDAFVRRFRGEEPVNHLHNSLTKLLEDTFGVILYQEQVLRIAHELGGLTIAEADILRRAMSHFDPGGVMVSLRDHFIHGAGERRGVPPETAERIWEMMAAFAGYGFPKAHAASYAQLAWQSAWCKTHYPAEFMAAVLGFEGGYYSQRVYLMEARRLGLPLHPPHVNHSDDTFKVIYPKGQPHLYMGLNQVRDLTQRTIQTILRCQPFHTLKEFLIRVDPHPKEAQRLAMCGALDGLATISQALARIEHKRPPGQLQLFNPSTELEDWSDEQKWAAQQEILGVNLGISPLEQWAESILASGAITTLEAEGRIGEKVMVAGMRQTWRRLRSRSNELMATLNLEDLEGSLQVFIPPRLYRHRSQHLQEQGPFLIEGIIEFDANRQQTHMVAEDITLLQ